MVRSAFIRIRLEPAVSEAATTAAAGKGRSPSKWVEMLMISRLRELKLLKDDPAHRMRAG
jgi:hypothetical protein